MRIHPHSLSCAVRFLHCSIAARYADGWNGWLAFNTSSPDVVRGVRGDLDEGAEPLVGTPRRYWRSVAVGVALPGRQITFGPWDIGSGALKGAPDELTDALLAFADVGVTHIQVYLGHGTAHEIDSFASVLERLDARAAPAPDIGSGGSACDNASRDPLPPPSPSALRPRSAPFERPRGG